MQTLLYKPIM